MTYNPNHISLNINVKTPKEIILAHIDKALDAYLEKIVIYVNPEVYKDLVETKEQIKNPRPITRGVK